MKLYYCVGLLALPIFTMHAQDVLKHRKTKLSQFLVASYPHRLVTAENARHNFDLAVARRSRDSSTTSQSSSPSSTPPPQQSPSTSPRKDATTPLEVISES